MAILNTHETWFKMVENNEEDEDGHNGNIKWVHNHWRNKNIKLKEYLLIHWLEIKSCVLRITNHNDLK